MEPQQMEKKRENADVIEAGKKQDYHNGSPALLLVRILCTFLPVYMLTGAYFALTLILFFCTGISLLTYQYINFFV